MAIFMLSLFSWWHLDFFTSYLLKIELFIIFIIIIIIVTIICKLIMSNS